MSGANETRPAMPEQKCDEPVMGVRRNKHLRKEKACCQDYDISEAGSSGGGFMLWKNSRFLP